MFEKLLAVRAVVSALRERPFDRNKVIDATERAFRAFDVNLVADKLDKLQEHLNRSNYPGIVSLIGNGVATTLEEFGFGRYSRFVELQTQAIAELLLAVYVQPVLMLASPEPYGQHIAELERYLPFGSVSEDQPQNVSPVQVVGILVALIRLWRDLRRA